MRTNIERAVHELILSNKDVTLENVLPAYLREAGFNNMSADALIAFEHALGKCPTHTDESRAVLLKGISGIITEYWANKYEAITCSHCGAQGFRKFNLIPANRGKAHGREHSEENESKNRRLKSKKKARRVRAKRDTKAEQFDPFGPSTSAVTL